jgi:clan AA aspartic protease
VTGEVDAYGRALLEVVLRSPRSKKPTVLNSWIDTGFTGDLLLPKTEIQSLGLRRGPVVPAVLADGTIRDAATYRCEIHWFGKWTRIEVLATDSTIPLLGVNLLLGRNLRISYRDLTVSLD